MIKRNRGITWKYMLKLMASGLPVCLLLLFALSRRPEGLHYVDYLSVAGAFLFSCLFLVVFNWAWSRQSAARQGRPDNRQT